MLSAARRSSVGLRRRGSEDGSCFAKVGRTARRTGRHHQRRRQFSSRVRPTFGRLSFVGWRRQETERRRHLGRGVGLRRVALAPEECRLDATGAGALRRTDA
jgi:hypothetical protein